MENQSVLSFQLIDGESCYFLFQNPNNTFNDLKKEVIEILPGFTAENYDLIVENYGNIDLEKENSNLLITLGLGKRNLYNSANIDFNNEYRIFLQNRKQPQMKWHTCCTNKILNDNKTNQVFYSVSGSYYCFACRYYCQQNIPFDTEFQNENTSSCQCNESCIFKKCYITDENLIKANRESIASFHEILFFLDSDRGISNKNRSFHFDTW